MFIRVLLPEPQRIVSGVFDCSRNVLVQIGIHETLTEAENGFRLLEGIPADSPQGKRELNISASKGSAGRAKSGRKAFSPFFTLGGSHGQFAGNLCDGPRSPESTESAAQID